MYAVTGATGQLGRIVVETLLETVAPNRIVAAVRDPAKAGDLAARGVHVRHADYGQPATLRAALAGVERLLLISSNEVGGRLPQHVAVIEAARAAGVALFGYTSILHADRSPLMLAKEHQETEAALAVSGLPTVLLRNGWYTENYLMALPAVLAHGALLGAAGAGRVSMAARADYAVAAARALTLDDQAGRTYELAGDAAPTLAELAAEIARQVGRAITYRDLPAAEYAGVLRGAGLPASLAEVLADADTGSAAGALFDDGHALSCLIGRPTTPIATTVAAALQG